MTDSTAAIRRTSSEVGAADSMPAIVQHLMSPEGRGLVLLYRDAVSFRGFARAPTRLWFRGFA